jgi:hypothetical protein
MHPAMIVVAVFLLGMGILLFEMLRTPAGIEREHTIEQGRISSRTRTITEASPDEFIRLLQTPWSWWERARAEPMKDLGNGLKEFVFHPVRYFNLIEQPTSCRIRFESIENLPDGGKRLHATLAGDFDGRAEYTARPGPGGTVVELAWCDAEVRGALRYMPIALVAAIHCWRERLGVQGLRARLASLRRG